MTINQEPRVTGLSPEGTTNGHDLNATGQGFTNDNLKRPDEAAGTTHPLGVLPLGNQYLSDAPKARLFSGTLQLLPDEMLSVLLEYLDAHALRRLGYTCKFLFAFSYATDFWKASFLE